MDKTLRIKVADKFAVYGRLNGSLKQPLFIVIHGLPGNYNEGFYERACFWFAKQGYATFRFNLYSWQKDARQLIDSTLKTHAADIDAVVRHFKRQGVKKIFLAGHSFGGPSILLSKEQKFDAAVLWDPSYDISFAHERYGFPGGKFIKSLNGYFMRWGANVIIGKKMAKEADTLKWAELPKQFRVPLKIIVAAKGVLVPGSKVYFEQAHEPKDLEIVKGATHYFDDEPKMQDHVFERTKKWFQKF